MRSIGQLMDLRGRVAVVTGGAGHIGAALGEALGELGASIAVVDIEESKAERVAARIAAAYGVQALSLTVDLTVERSVRQLPDDVLRRLGRLDILVNCAALVGSTELRGWTEPFAKQGAEAFRLACDANLIAPFLLTQACAHALSVSGHGSVINLSSIYGMVGPRMSLYEGTSLNNPAAYAATKGGLLQLTRWLATVLAPEVRVNSITPGGVRRNQSDQFQTRFLSHTPLGRMATEEDFKGAVAYLASDLSAYVTGHNLVVDGGWTAW